MDGGGSERGGIRHEGDELVATYLSRMGWSITVDTIWDGSFAGSQAIDGNTATCWHSQNLIPYPHYMIVDMGSAQTFNVIQYVARQDFRTSDPAQVALYVSDDGVTWGSPIATDTWVSDITTKYLAFASVTKRYFKFQGNTGASGTNFMACAEIYAGTGTPAARVTQVAREVLVGANPNARVTQVAREVLVGADVAAAVQPQMMVIT